MSSNVPAPPNSNQNQELPNQYPPPPMANYGAAYPAPMNQGAYPPPVQNIPSGNPAYPPPPSYDSSFGQPTPNPYGQNYPYPTPVSAPPPSYPPPSSEVAFPGSNTAYHDRIISFDDKIIRLGFIRRVFAVLMLQLATTVGFICLFLFEDRVKLYVQSSWGMYISAYVLFFVLYFVLVCCDSVRRSYPANVILLIAFTLSLSYFVGVISSFHQTDIVLITMGVTTLVCASVMIFACQTKYDFTPWGGVLFCVFWVIIFLSIFTPLWMLLNTTAGIVVIGGLLALVYVAFLAYDVQRVMGGKKYELSPEEYIFASLILYIDIVRIFLLLLAIFGRCNN